jgi:hypothetical protein
MNIKYYVDFEGKYIGGFEGSIPESGIEVPTPPNHGLEIWNGSSWDDRILSKDEQIAAIESTATARWLRMGPLGDAIALAELQNIEDQIEVIRNA